jgi:hypothetical protein
LLYEKIAAKHMMKNSKLIVLLEKLDGYQWRSLSRFVVSPYANASKEVEDLFRYLYKKREAGYALQTLHKPTVYGELFPATSYHNQHLNQLMSLLFKLVEKWLIIASLDEQPILAENLKARQFLKMKLDKHLLFSLASSKKMIRHEPHKTEHYYYQYQVEELAEQHFTSQKSRRHHPALQQASESLDDFFVLQKLRYFCEMLNRQQLTGYTYELTLAPYIKAYFKHEQQDDNVLISLYYHLFQILSPEEDALSFEAFMHLLLDNFTRLDKSESQHLWYYAINYCIGQIREGDRKYAPRLFALYTQGVETGILLDEGTISPWTFKNMVKLGLNLKRYDWVENFVKTYADLLPENKKEDALHYNLAELYFFLGQYDAALAQLRHVEFTDIHYNLGSRALLAKIYYEQQQWDALEAVLTAFLVFLRRNQTISNKVKAPYRNFCRMLSALLRRLPTQYAPLIKKLNDNKNINNRDWLLEQMSAATTL